MRAVYIGWPKNLDYFLGDPRVARRRGNQRFDDKLRDSRGGMDGAQRLDRLLSYAGVALVRPENLDGLLGDASIGIGHTSSLAWRPPATS